MATKKTMEEILAAKKAVGDNGHLQRKSTNKKEAYIKLFMESTEQQEDTDSNPENKKSEPEKESIIINKDFEQEITEAAQEAKKIVELPLSLLAKSRLNKFCEYSEEEFELLCSSIRQHGQWDPLLVRPAKEIENKDYDFIPEDCLYEILAGQNRYNALKATGATTAKCIVMHCNDVIASQVAGQSNPERHISEVERARAYRTTYDLLKREQGGDRKSQNFNEKSSCNSCNLKKTLEIVAEKYGLSERTMANKIRLAYLEPEVEALLEKGKITQDMAIDISYGDSRAQQMLLQECKPLTKEVIKIFKEVAKEETKQGDQGPVPAGIFQERVKSLEENIKEEKKLAKQMKTEREYTISNDIFPKNHKLEKFEQTRYVQAAVSYIIENNLQEQIYDYWQSQESKAIETPKEV